MSVRTKTSCIEPINGVKTAEKLQTDNISKKILLVGNPNVGKTTIFNLLTGSTNHVGNWHGVTVDTCSKRIIHNGSIIEITDLPGLYSLTAAGAEERISAEIILARGYDLILNIVDMCNLSRNLYLTCQLLEAGAPVTVVCNMAERFRLEGGDADIAKLSKIFRVPFVNFNLTKDGRRQLLDACVLPIQCRDGGTDFLRVNEIQVLSRNIGAAAKRAGLSPMFAATKLYERDTAIAEKLNIGLDALKIPAGSEGVVSAKRYEFIDSVVAKTVKKESSVCRNGCGSCKTDCGGSGNFSAAYGESRLDKIILNKYLAVPIFLLVMAAVFWLAFGSLGRVLSDGINFLIDGLALPAISNVFFSWTPDWVRGLITDGIVRGAGSVASFFPQVMLMYLALAALEDSGYMSRVAFVCDGLLEPLGLSGKSVFTMIMGFGCSTAALTTAKNLETKQVRLKTMLLTPYMSCSAKLPVYAVVASVFFTNNFLIIFLLYLAGIIIAVALAAVFNMIPSLKTHEGSFIMEMPPYRKLSPKRLIKLTLKNAGEFFVRVGTVVLAINIIVWILCNFSLTAGYGTTPDLSLMATLAGFIKNIFAPLGFGTWQAATALLSGLVAKETVITTIASLGGAAAVFSSSQAALSFLVFVLLYTPCISALGVIAKEAGIKWAVFSFVLNFVVAYAAAFAVYFIGIRFF